jgi:sugar phosphate isomerase/epimerase
MSSMRPSACVCCVRVDRDIALAVLTVLELSPVEMIGVAARCGYSHVGLRPLAATADEVHFPILTDAALRRDTLSALDDHGLGVLDIEILRLKPETRVAEFESVLAFGAAFGARFALVAGNDPDLSRAADNLAALCELSAAYGIRPHLEFMPWTNVPNMAAALDVANATGRDNVGLLVDAFHLNRSGGTATDVPLNDPRFGYVQLCDIAGPVPADMADILREARAERLFPGEGDCPLLALLRRLATGIPISIEAPAEQLHLPAEVRAQRAFDATHEVLETLSAMA